MIRIYERTDISQFTFGNIAKDSTGGGPMDLPGSGQPFHSGILQSFSISCDSTNFDVSIRNKSNGLPNTPSEIYNVTGVNLYRADAGLGVAWRNSDSPLSGKMYLVLTNNDGANATGEVLAEVMTDVPKRFSANR
jgi:hypothetical protein